jgi:VanZ family protein
MGIIFYYSSQSKTPGVVVDDKEGATLALRKLAHAAEFGTLALLLRAALGFLKRGTAHALAFAIAGANAIADEWHQRFTPGRVGSLQDVFIDFGGILAVPALWWLAEEYLTRRHAHN